jgi:hypothetical protein
MGKQRIQMSRWQAWRVEPPKLGFRIKRPPDSLESGTPKGLSPTEGNYLFD